MVMNLFSVFDPSSSNQYSLNWISMMIILLLIPNMFWFIPSRFIMINLILINYLINEFKVLANKNINKFNLIIYMSLFLFIMLNNLLGMFPYIFTSTSHLILSLSLSLILWFSYMIFGWYKNMNFMFIHLVPQGTPMILMPFMVLIESISNIIRPGTLAVRLSANIIAGHLLMTLISSTGNNLNLILLYLMLLTQSLLILLELSVVFIQAYVFSVLSMLYSTETN